MCVFSMNERCDQIIQCQDKSDEDKCSLLVFEESYNKLVPPVSFNSSGNNIIPVSIRVSTSLRNVLEISEFTHTIDLKLGISLEWYDNRLLFHNLKSKAALNVLSNSEVCLSSQWLNKYPNYQMDSIWVPYIIFRNTDNDEAVEIRSTRTVVSVKRQGNFSRSGLDVADEVVCYKKNL